MPERVRLDFDVRGSTLAEVRERANAVVQEFLQLDKTSVSSHVADLEINIQGTAADGHPEPPMPSYNFIGHVHVRIKQ